MTDPQRRIPQGFGWNIVGIEADYTAWQSGFICALSSIVYLHDEEKPPHWEWLISFSKNGRSRLSDKEIKIALKAFDAQEFEEDNHEPGIARKFWLSVDPKYRKPCDCKDEMVITEGDYRYSQKKDKS